MSGGDLQRVMWPSADRWRRSELPVWMNIPLWGVHVRIRRRGGGEAFTDSLSKLHFRAEKLIVSFRCVSSRPAVSVSSVTSLLFHFTFKILCCYVFYFYSRQDFCDISFIVLFLFHREAACQQHNTAYTNISWISYLGLSHSGMSSGIHINKRAIKTNLSSKTKNSKHSFWSEQRLLYI